MTARNSAASSNTTNDRLQRLAQAAGVEMSFFEDDLTNLRHDYGTLGLLVDFGAMNDMNQEGRDLYVQNLMPLTHPGSRYLLFGFEKKFEPDEVERRFGEYFSIATFASKSNNSTFSPRFALYLMTRKEEVMFIDKMETEFANLKDLLEAQE